MDSFSLVAATGMLGSGFLPESIGKAIDLGAQMIGCDAGSTDAGPIALAKGECHFSRDAVKRDVEAILTQGVPAGLPIVIGSAGTAGSDRTLAWLLDIVREIARENALHFRMAAIHSELSKQTVLDHLRAGRTRPLPPSRRSMSRWSRMLHIVGMMGIEPIQQALKGGSQVVIAGRSSDTSIYAALPLMKGFDPGIVWHMAKILECGAAAVTQRTGANSMMAVVHPDSFDVFPIREDYRCSPQSIASQRCTRTPIRSSCIEPSGTLITRDSRYEAISDRAVRVSGSRLRPNEGGYSIKIEGVRQVGYSTIVPGAVRDPYILAQLDRWLEQLDRNIRARLARTIGNRKFDIVTRVYGRDGVMGEPSPTRASKATKFFILWDVVSESQELSHTIASSLSHMAVHNPIPKWHGLISGVAYPFSPNEIDRGPVNEFHLNHVLLPENPLSLFPMEFEEV